MAILMNSFIETFALDVNRAKTTRLRASAIEPRRRHFREWKIDVEHVLEHPEEYGVKILNKDFAKLGKNTRKSPCGRRDYNDVIKCVTCGHDDYEDDGIVYAIIIQENEGTHKNPKYVDRITWVDDYGWPILKENDRRISAQKNKKRKTAYAVVSIPDERPNKKRNTREVLLHQLLFNDNEEYGRGPFFETDHIQHTNGLNNLLANVRDGAPDGTRHQNMNNQSMRKDNTSGHTGVSNQKGRNGWRVKYEVFDSESKTSSIEYEYFPYTKDDAVDKQEQKNAAVEFRKKMYDDKYLNDLEEYYTPIHTLHKRWLYSSEMTSSFESTKFIVRSFEQHWQSFRPSILELTRTSK